MDGPPAGLTRHMQTPLVLVLLGSFVAVLWVSRTYLPGARLFPQAVAGAGLLLAGLELVRQWRTRGKEEAPDHSDLESEDHGADSFLRGLLHFAWLAGYLALFLAIGALIATAVYVAAFLRLHCRENRTRSLGLAGTAVLLLWILGLALRLRWPEPLLF